MANPKHLAMLKKGVASWNRWKQKDRNLGWGLKEADLSEANLRKAKLAGANLSRTLFTRSLLDGADLRGTELFSADLREALVTNANLSGANLISADLSEADLAETRLGGADLSGASLCGADLTLTDFSWATLHRADFTNARLVGTTLWSADLLGATLTGAEVGHTAFGDIDLSTVKGLETVTHNGPSAVGIDTIFRSKGNIPESFLRGAGVPEDFITYMKSLAGTAIEYYSCFISYSTKDQAFADRLYADLQNKGVRCWFAPHDVQGGRKLHEQIDEAIRLHDKLLLILSPHSMASEWVKTEIAKARKREVRDRRRVLFPIRLAPFESLRDWECFDADTGKDSAREIREYFIPDFSNWKDHDSYREAFQRLISDLKASDAKPK
jgi:uncharacterized protein YjbI with pentapeptide repeats